jgi:hypothetical protein
MRADANDAPQKLFRHLTAMPACPFLKSAANSAEIPSILARLKCLGHILGPQDPGIVRKSALGIGPRIGVYQLPRRRHPNVLAIKRKVFAVFDEMKKMRMAAAKLLGAVDPKRVIPDNPTSAGEPKLSLKDHLELGGKLIADRQPKGTSGFQNPGDLFTPNLGPGKVIIRLVAIVIDIVAIANVERGIGKDKIDGTGLDLLQPFNTVPMVKAIQVHFGILFPFTIPAGRPFHLSSMEGRSDPQVAIAELIPLIGRTAMKRRLLGVLAGGAVLLLALTAAAQPPDRRDRGPDQDKGPPGRSGGFRGERPPGPPGPFEPGKVLPPPLRRDLALSRDQEKQLDDLEKEVKDRLMKILTDEQKRKLKSMAQRRPGPGRPGGPPDRENRRSLEGRPPGDRPPDDEDRPRNPGRPPRPERDDDGR